MTSGKPLSQEDIDECWDALRAAGGNKLQAAQSLGMARSQFYKRLLATPVVTEQDKSPFAAEHAPEIGTAGGALWEIKSTADNKFRFGAFGDLHAASKYCRWDVRADLIKKSEDFGALALLDCGNWIDGEARFNRHDLTVAAGLESQLECLADNYPKTRLPTYAITGRDHEGWYKGVDVGRHCEHLMREHGHAWTNLGYIEADIVLRNANSGETAIMRLVHPGGGSAYALSYKPQKIIESNEGGEKPDVLLIGHYHKLECGNIRNIWYAQTGCQQDQTPFLRTQSIEVHVGGILLEMEQNPKDGTIISFKPDLRRYYNRGYYFQTGQANQRWSGHGPIKQVPRSAESAA